jgi:hypothetical protein
MEVHSMGRREKAKKAREREREREREKDSERERERERERLETIDDPPMPKCRLILMRRLTTMHSLLFVDHHPTYYLTTFKRTVRN